MLDISQKLPFEPIDLRALGRVEIGQGGPGTVLRDLDALLAYIKERDLPLTGKGQLPLRALPEINARLARPIEHGLRRPLLKSFPHIQGLYLLARTSGLTEEVWAGDKPRLVVDEQAEQAWRRLNPTERYGNLLEAWFLRGRPEIVGEPGSRLFRIPQNFSDSLSFFARIPDQGLQVAGDPDVEGLLRFRPGGYNLGLLDLFGLIEVQRAAPEPGLGWRIERIARTRLGEAVFVLLQAGLFGDLEKIGALEGEKEIPSGVFQPMLRPILPEWRNNLVVSRWAFRDGVHVFTVSLGRAWRRIAVPADASLDTLASAILDAFAFDSDHLYEFVYRDRFGAAEHAHHPYMDEGPWTSEVAVGDVPLQVGQGMTFVYDFGDWWQFAVKLERVDAGTRIRQPKVIAKQGRAPKQYPTWDEDG